MPLGTVSGTGTTIAYEVLGEADATPLLLVHGLGMQLVSWHPDLLQLLLRRGYRLLILDNRDAGLSTHFSEFGEPDIERLLARDPAAAAYSLADLADDTAGVLELAGWESAHVLGVSMGAMIAQELAIRHPQRVRSLTSIMGTTGADGVGEQSDAALATMLAPPAKSREDAVAVSVEHYRVIASTGFPHDLEYVRRRSELAYDRAFDPAATVRQVAAIIAGGDRTGALRRLRLPALVVHGDGDPLVAVSGGRATAAAIPGADYLEIEGMGHDLPCEVWPRLIDRVDDVVMRGESSRRAA